MTEQAGFREFLEWVEANFINHEMIYRVNARHWSEETKDYVISLFDGGLPSPVISLATNLNHPTVRNWLRKYGRDISHDTEHKRNIIREWYVGSFDVSELSEEDRFPVTLESYIESYGGAIVNGYNDIINSLFKLNSRGYNFPFVPRPTNAYLVGNNIGDGYIGNDNYSLNFIGPQQEMEMINAQFNLDGNLGLLNEAGSEYYFPSGRATRNIEVYTLRCTTALGRLYYLLGVPKGVKVDQHFLIPNWIIDNEVEYGNQFLGGLFDSNGNIFLGNSRGDSDVSVTVYKIPELRSNLEEFLEQTASLLEQNQIHLRQGVKIYSREDRLVGRVTVSPDKSNLTRFRSRIGLRYENRVRNLQTLLGLPDGYLENPRIAKEAIFQHIITNNVPVSISDDFLLKNPTFC